MKFSWTITEKFANKTVQEYLRQEKELSKRLIKQLKRTDGGIKVNKQEVTVRKRLQLNDELVITLEESRKSVFKGVKIPLHIIFEDEHLLVVNKKAGLLTIPTKDCNYSLANGIVYYYDQEGLPYTVHIVTRLDRDTSGLVLIAKHKYAHHLMAKLQQQNQIKRTYEALVHGKMQIHEGTINRPIARDETSLIKRKVSSEGKQAITHYHKLKSVNNCTLLEVQLETGRTHQIRVHFASLGHPIVGDTLYGSTKQHIGRHYLHCKQLGFVHPFTGKELRFDLPVFERKVSFNL